MCVSNIKLSLKMKSDQLNIEKKILKNEKEYLTTISIVYSIKHVQYKKFFV